MVKKKSKKEKGGSSLKNSDAAAAVSLKNSDAAAASLKNSDAAAAASTSMRFESDEEKARLLFSERLISMIKGDEISLRFKNYISKFYTKEEMQQAENDLIDKSDRMDKNETKYIYQRLTKAVNNTIRLNGYERFAKKCAEERDLEEAHKKRFGAAEIELWTGEPQTNKKKKKPKKKDTPVVSYSSRGDLCTEKEQSTSLNLSSKYRQQRYKLFSLYDKGVGGNTIQFTKVCSSVIAIDIDPLKIKMAVNNATVYGVVDRVDYVVGDFINLALKADILFLSPPWGGPMYNKVGRYTLDIIQPKDGQHIHVILYSLFRIARSITPNIIMFLPRNIDLEQLEELARLSSPPLTLEIEENYVQGKIKAIKAYFSCSAKKNLTFHLSESPTELESDLRQVLKIVQNSETTIKKLVLDLEASFDRKMDKLTKEIKEIKTLISRFNTRW
ncbi:BnaC07g48690D [Brassica napus]|uniref:Trimethylguanosine synthase n=1 Tax=Brassica napus TaxID=3708 RepID=A0A078IYX8_BRANA|nr:unnamed protein product [Brassica napus]CDY57504.1 BnaC07g48690D [Brassica napus]